MRRCRRQGHQLIKRAAKLLLADVEGLQELLTLSPIPGMVIRRADGGRGSAGSEQLGGGLSDKLSCASHEPAPRSVASALPVHSLPRPARLAGFRTWLLMRLRQHRQTCDASATAADQGMPPSFAAALDSADADRVLELLQDDACRYDGDGQQQGWSVERVACLQLVEGLCRGQAGGNTRWSRRNG